MKIYPSVLEVIGRTPLVQLQRLPRRWGCDADIVLKLEGLNPAQSVKDRIAASMIMEAENAGLIQPGISTIVEATSGNTGIGLAMVCAARGYRLILTMPEHMSRERQQILRAYGAEVILTAAQADMPGAIAHANYLLGTLTNAFSPHQFSNPANPKIHYETTGPEIWEDTDGDFGVFVVGVGTGGTLTGAGQYLKQQNPLLKIVAVEPSHSAILSGQPAGQHDLQGLGAGFIPDVLRIDLIDEIITVTEAQAYETGRQLAQEEGILSGISTGAAVYAAVQIGRRPEFQGQRIVVIQPSGGERYLSTRMWNSAKPTGPLPETLSESEL
ncbi:cysteine synthase A [Synechococcus sp. CS-602]|uniref:cysteine synthase A n=1 Tax=Synechococcaceae TaxID=1890426 RepID=UPI0008FF3E64|nr:MULTISPECIES: cysteine synthase A [Synechococcaceae]MCT4363296.1 cysteine synthase A [Candidatus Regnicoccus frigidus MAG-AL1]APD47154.1 cysteine synthase A [Synechococcus sp. SynAce01]MCT0202014.1 cysteine synthase A [Synechococcus sp. CS-603]MCT0205022.1 cysteine synthase A [Synechococcus sp. CS-602]MCT0246226.1 cysteine synthase A [Synechococcus sp. CS-601]